MTKGGDLLEAIGEKFGAPTPQAARHIKGSGTLTITTKGQRLVERYDSVFEAMESVSERICIVELFDLISGTDLVSLMTPDTFDWKADIKDTASMDVVNAIIQKAKAQ